MSASDHANNRFTSKAAVYGGRPEWPDFVYALMLEKTGFDPNDKAQMKNIIAVDVGAGTGKTTFPLADLGCTVIAVEPNAEMLQKLNERKAEGGYDNVIAVQGDAFNLNIPDEFKGKVNLFYTGNAAHWWGSRVAGNGEAQEKKAVSAWRPYAHPNAQMSIMYLRAKEDDEYVRELRDIMFKHFELTRNNPTEPCSMRLFEFSAFKDYFGSKAKKAAAETYVPTEYALRDYAHFQEWLMSHSYFPNDGFEKPEVEKEFNDFYKRAVARSDDGIAKMAFGVRLYTGNMRYSGVDLPKVAAREDMPFLTGHAKAVVVDDVVVSTTANKM